MSKFADGLASKRQRLAKKVHVKEWDEDLYFYPQTVNSLKRTKKHADRAGGDEYDQWVYHIIFNALDKQGNELFDLNDVPFLLNEESTVIIDIFLKATQREPDDELSDLTETEKKSVRSKKTPADST